MIWDAGPGHGFTEPDVEPWLPFGDGHSSVSHQRGDPRSSCRGAAA